MTGSDAFTLDDVERLVVAAEQAAGEIPGAKAELVSKARAAIDALERLAAKEVSPDELPPLPAGAIETFTACCDSVGFLLQGHDPVEPVAKVYELTLRANPDIAAVARGIIGRGLVAFGCREGKSFYGDEERKAIERAAHQHAVAIARCNLRNGIHVPASTHLVHDIPRLRGRLESVLAPSSVSGGAE